MPRVHHGKVRKDHPNFGIKKGDDAYWWTVKTGPVSGVKYYSKTPPKASQLTHSEFQSTMADIEDDISGLPADEGLEDAVNEIAGRLRELGEEQQGKFDNMPEGLQQGDTGQMIEARASKCGEIADELEGIDWSKPDDDDNSKEDEGDDADDEFWQEKLTEVQGIDLSTD